MEVVDSRSLKSFWEIVVTQLSATKSQRVYQESGATIAPLSLAERLLNETEVSPIEWPEH